MHDKAFATTHTLVREVPSIEIGDGIVTITGEGWGLCGTPAMFTQFVNAGLRAIKDWQGKAVEPVPLRKTGEKLRH